MSEDQAQQPHKPEIGGSFHSVVLDRSDRQKPWGMKIRQDPGDNSGVFISELDPEGIAGKNGGLELYDEVVEINSQSIRSKGITFATSTLKSSDSITVMVLRRPESERPKIAPPRQGSMHSIRSTPSAHVLDQGPHFFPDTQTMLLIPREVCLKKENGSFGMLIKLDVPTGLVYIKEIITNGAAANTGQLAVKDWILEIDHHSMRGTGRELVAEALRGKDQVTLTVARIGEAVVVAAAASNPVGAVPPPEMPDLSRRTSNISNGTLESLPEHITAPTTTFPSSPPSAARPRPPPPSAVDETLAQRLSLASVRIGGPAPATDSPAAASVLSVGDMVVGLRVGGEDLRAVSADEIAAAVAAGKSIDVIVAHMRL
jgi:hypothetical protein